MRLGVLIIGSLYWSPSPVRCRWRQDRLSVDDKCAVKVPIRYGRKSKRNGTYSMVFSQSCSEPTRLGCGLVVPARVECAQPRQLLEEAGLLWAAERHAEQSSGICSNWGKVCLLNSPEVDSEHAILKAWRQHVAGLGQRYSALSRSIDEEPVLDEATGFALFDWPKDVRTNEPLRGLDLLLMTANEPSLESGRYPTPQQIASAWREDQGNNISYFYKNRKHGIMTFEDSAIEAILRGDSAA